MFGGGAGTILDMIIRDKNNKALLRKKNPFKRDWNLFSIRKEYFKAAKGKIDLKKASHEEIMLIRAKVLLQRRKDFFRSGIALCIIVPIIVFSTYKFINLMIIEKPGKIIQQAELNKLNEDYLFFINDGDHWLNLKHWHNAIFQYKNAIDLFPSDFNANYRLALAYTNSCFYEKENCEKAKNLVDQLIQIHIDKSELHQLRDSIDSNNEK